MPIVLEAKTEEDYAQWVADQKAGAAATAAEAGKTWNKEDLMAKGESVYDAYCASCHQANGQGIPGVFPGIAGSPVATGDIAKHIDIGVNGVAGTAMQAFGEQLGDADLAAVITYQRNAFGNNTGDLIQPSDIKAAR